MYILEILDNMDAAIKILSSGSNPVCRKTAKNVMAGLGCTTMTKHCVITSINDYVTSKGGKTCLRSPLLSGR